MEKLSECLIWKRKERGTGRESHRETWAEIWKTPVGIRARNVHKYFESINSKKCISTETANWFEFQVIDEDQASLLEALME